MAKKPKKAKPEVRRTYVREWRKHREMTQAELAERVNLSQGALSDLENGLFAYTQPTLEALAKALRCRPGDLIERPPGETDQVQDALHGLSGDARKRALAVILALKDTDAA